MADLTDLSDRSEIINLVDRLLRENPLKPGGNERRMEVLVAGLAAVPRVGEDFARWILNQILPAYDALPEPRKGDHLYDKNAMFWARAAFLEQAFYAAAHFDHIEYTQPLLNRFRRLFLVQHDPEDMRVFSSLTRQFFRGLRKFGMLGVIDTSLKQMAEKTLQGQTLAALRRQPSTRFARLAALLEIAAGWLYFGMDEHAHPVLEEARQLLLEQELGPRDQKDLACAYVTVLGQLPGDLAFERVEELVREVRGVRDTYTTSSHYSVSHLEVVEAVVLAAVDIALGQGQALRRWLDEDEYLIRRRVHHDWAILAAQQRQITG